MLEKDTWKRLFSIFPILALLSGVLSISGILGNITESYNSEGPPILVTPNTVVGEHVGYACKLNVTLYNKTLNIFVYFLNKEKARFVKEGFPSPGKASVGMALCGYDPSKKPNSLMITYGSSSWYYNDVTCYRTNSMLDAGVLINSQPFCKEHYQVYLVYVKLGSSWLLSIIKLFNIILIIIYIVIVPLVMSQPGPLYDTVELIRHIGFGIIIPVFIANLLIVAMATSTVILLYSFIIRIIEIILGLGTGLARIYYSTQIFVQSVFAPSLYYALMSALLVWWRSRGS